MPVKSATIRVSEGGQLVLPMPMQHSLGIHEGDALDASVENGRIVLTPQKGFPGKDKPEMKAQIIQDPVLGIPVLTFGPGAPILTSEEVAEALADFP